MIEKHTQTDLPLPRGLQSKMHIMRFILFRRIDSAAFEHMASIDCKEDSRDA